MKISLSSTGRSSVSITGTYRDRLSNTLIYRSGSTVLTELDYIATRYGAKLAECSDCG